jgi:hypothetical protein
VIACSCLWSDVGFAGYSFTVRLGWQREPRGYRGERSSLRSDSGLNLVLLQEMFRKVFDQFGDVLLVRMFPKSKCAFITYKNPQQALASLKLEGSRLGSMDLTLNVGKVRKQ